MLSGVLAGLAAKTAVYPLDVAKKRLQVQGFQQHRHGFGQVSAQQTRAIRVTSSDSSSN